MGYKRETDSLNKVVALDRGTNRILNEVKGFDKVFDFKPLAPHRCGFESQNGPWILSGEEAIQHAYGTLFQAQTGT
jgi:hypothetical protein